MPNRILKTKQDCLDFLTGLKLMGTGGGGPTETGLELMEGAMQEGFTLKWIDVSEMAEDESSCTVFGSGAISTEVPKNQEEVNRLGQKLGLENKYGERAIEMAVRELEKYTGGKVGAIVPAELGGSNTPAPLVIAARMGLSLIDGDYSGRAVPQDMQTTYFLKGIMNYPAAITDWWGDVVILKQAASIEMGERIGKLLSVASYGKVYMATTLLNAQQTREMVVPGTLTKSLEMGQAVRKARENHQDPVQAAVEVLKGWRLFSGEVTSKDWDVQSTGSVGITHLKGVGRDAGHTLDIYFFNENHIALLDGKPFVSSPDLIITANPESGEGYTNPEIKAGDAVEVIGAKVYPAFRSELALKYFGPRYWGYDFDYIPIETVMAGKN
jgi:uncharacterized protein